MDSDILQDALEVRAQDGPLTGVTWAAVEYIEDWLFGIDYENGNYQNEVEHD